MPRVGARGALIGLAALALLLGGGAMGAQSWARGQVDQALEGRGVSWTGTQHGFRHLHYEGLEGSGLTTGVLEVDLLSRRAVLWDARLEISRQGSGDGEAVQGPGQLARLSAVTERVNQQVLEMQRAAKEGGLAAVEVSRVTLETRDEVLISDVSGTVLPSLGLEFAEGRLRQVGDRLEGELTLSLEEGPVRGLVELKVAADGGLSVQIPEARLSHERLAKRSIGPLAIAAEVDDGSLRLRAGPSLEIRVGPAVDGVHKVELPEVALAHVVGLFGSSIPEARRARMSGKLAFEGELAGPPWTLTGKLEITEPLAVEGLISDPAALRRGGITWRVPDGSGGTTVQEASPMVASWVRVRDAEVLIEAILASEDSGFRRHGGFDPVAVSEALEAMAADRREGRELRLLGASTLTQQLAKNLFLDPEERTVARKVRELLYALDLEGSVGKERILELYLNIVEMGPDLYGMGAAAETFFLKRASGLSVREAAYLAYVLPAPKQRYHQLWMADRAPVTPLDTIIDKMVDTGALSPSEAAAAKADKLRFVPPAR